MATYFPGFPRYQVCVETLILNLIIEPIDPSETIIHEKKGKGICSIKLLPRL